MTFLLPPFSGGFQFAVAGGQDLLVPPLELVLRREITNGRVQANRVVVFDELAYDPSGVFQGQRSPWPDTLLFEDTMPTLDLGS